MPRLRALVATITVCALCTFLSPTTIHAQEIIDPWAEETQSCGGEKQELLSRKWILQKVDCAADSLVKGLVDEGVSILSDIAKELISAAVSQFLPALGSLLDSIFGGGGGDPFAQHVQTILDHVDKATAEIIDNAIDLYATEVISVDVPSLRDEVLRYESYVPGQLGVAADSIEETRKDLNRARIALQRQDVFDGGVPSLHHYIVVVGALLEVESLAAFSLNYKASVPPGEEPESPEVRDWMKSETERIFTSGVDKVFNGATAEGVFEYLANLSQSGEYRRYSDGRFSEPVFESREVEKCGRHAHKNSRRVYNKESWTWEFTEDPVDRVAQPVVRKFAWTHERIQNHNWISGGNFHGCPTESSFRIRLVERRSETSNKGRENYVEDLRDFVTGASAPEPLIDFVYRAKVYVDDGKTYLDEMPDPLPGPQFSHKIQRDWAYEELVLSSYGAARPVIDSWWDLVNPGQERPILDIDYDLEEFVTSSVPAAAALGRLTDALPSGMDDETWRWAVNLVLEYGADAVETAAYAVELQARNQDPHGLSGYASELARAKAEYERLEGIKDYVTELQRRQAAYEYRVKIRNYVTDLLRTNTKHEDRERLRRKLKVALQHHLATSVFL